MRQMIQLLAQESIGQRVVRLFEVRADAEDSAVDAGLGFAVKIRSAVEPLKHQLLVDAVDHFARLLVGRVETEVLQEDPSTKRNK